MVKKRVAPNRQTQAQGAKILSAHLENADVFRTAKGGGPAPNGPAVLVLRRRSDFHRADFDRKAKDLARLGQEGKLVKTKSDRNSNRARDRRTGDPRTRTNVYRDRIISRLTKGNKPGRNTPKYEANKRLAELLFRPKQGGKNPITGPGQGLDPDHIHELQLGGSDTYDNLRLMDSWTNRQIGSDIATALRDVPDGTPVIVRVI